ncbi:hypothetical protein JY651_14605 [Pyxidicoccus parkwayensis]|uniref:Lipoprotein n=1 Tax=Pyxidicoccus parkwayensis TaxID=2813578 RepID=A0ABX7P6G5_9BACT|nr:hypothetical protein [Pyxidicoccus parkwaysis]QSQ26075.1 hypothetical protein JY651_14605 [Pyxidicoccus parkwaysis]
MLLLLAALPARAEEDGPAGAVCHGTPPSDAPRLSFEEAQPRICQLRGTLLSSAATDSGVGVRLTDVPAGSVERDHHLIELTQSRFAMNRKALKLLAGWSLANIAVSGVGYFTSDGDPWRTFHLSNVIFNVPVLGTVVLGAIVMAKQDPERLTLEETLSRAIMLERVLLAGIVVDVAVIGFGAFLWERGRLIGSDSLIGWGRADVFQGSVLLLFDSALFLMNARYDSKVMMMLAPEPNGGASVAMRMRF